MRGNFMVKSSMGILRDLHGFGNVAEDIALDVDIEGVFDPGEPETASDYGWTPASPPSVDDVVAKISGQQVALTAKEINQAYDILLQAASENARDYDEP